MAVEFPRKGDRDPHRAEMFEQFAARMPINNQQTAIIGRLALAYRELGDHQIRINRDETNTPGAKLVKFAKVARKTMVPLIETLDAKGQEAAEDMSKLQAHLVKAYDPPNRTLQTALLYQEIRQHVKGMDPKAAFAMLQSAQDSYDLETVTALASAPRFLSGLPPELHQQSRQYLIEVRAPTEAAALEALQEQQKLADQFRNEIVTSVGNLVDFAKADEIIAAAKDDLAA